MEHLSKRVLLKPRALLGASHSSLRGYVSFPSPSAHARRIVYASVGLIGAGGLCLHVHAWYRDKLDMLSSFSHASRAADLPTTVSLPLRLGLGAWQSGDLSMAIECFEKAAQACRPPAASSPLWVGIQCNLLALYEQVNAAKYKSALDLLYHAMLKEDGLPLSRSVLIRLNILTAQYYAGLGSEHIKLAKSYYDLALNALAQSASEHGSVADEAERLDTICSCLVSYAELCAQMGEFRLASQLLSKSLALLSSPPLALSGTGSQASADQRPSLLALLGSRADAVLSFVFQVPTHAQLSCLAPRSLGKVAGEWTRSQKFVYIYYLLGFCAFELSEPSLSLHYVRHAKEWLPQAARAAASDGDTWLTLPASIYLQAGESFLLMGRKDEAQKECRMALEMLRSDSPFAAKALSRAVEKQILGCLDQ